MPVLFSWTGNEGPKNIFFIKFSINEHFVQGNFLHLYDHFTSTNLQEVNDAVKGNCTNFYDNY